MYNVKAFLPDSGPTLHAAELASQQAIEAIQVVLGPADTGAAHHARKALLVDADGVLDESEVDEGDLEDVERQVTLKDASPVDPSQ